jgi:exopolyphosphatase/guanosine-5'-triphosphate,3'-diphosphate pyrophosphatase
MFYASADRRKATSVTNGLTSQLRRPRDSVFAVPQPARVAVVDLGTNSTRLLVANVSGGSVEELERRSVVTRLGDGVDASGRLADEAMDRVFDTLADYRDAIDEHGADPVIAVATSAVRDSANGDEFRAELRERFGIDARIITGDEEARLTFLGATSGRDASIKTLVIDIGGGSTELVIGHAAASEPDFHVSTQAGSVRQSERHLHDDPPTGEQLDALRREVRQIVDDAVPHELRAAVEHGIAVAGTATQLAAIDLELEERDSDRVDGHGLTRERCEELLSMLAAKPLAERRKVRGLHPDRAPTIVAGAAILLEAMGAFELGAVEVAKADILHGAAIVSSDT